MLNRANLTKAGRVAVYATQTIGVHLLVDPLKDILGEYQITNGRYSITRNTRPLRHTRWPMRRHRI